MARDVTIRISAEDNFSSVMQKYSQAVGEAKSTTEDAGKTAGEQPGKFDSLKDSVLGAVAAFGAMKIVSIGLELNDIGRQATMAQATFTALSGGAEAAAANLAAMRTATGNVVSDMQLMASANQLMQMGLAKSGDEAAKLASMAVVLGRAMGRDAEKSFSDFSLMLANQSIMRLDQFGISGAKVRDEIQKLIDSGQAANREEAFKMAVLDQGTQALGRLGDAAHAGETALGRLETSAENTKIDIGKNVNTGVEGIIGIAEIATGNNPIQQRQKAAIEQYVRDNLADYQQAFNDAMSKAGGVGMGSGQFTPDMFNMPAAIAAKLKNQALGGADLEKSFLSGGQMSYMSPDQISKMGTVLDQTFATVQKQMDDKAKVAAQEAENKSLAGGVEMMKAIGAGWKRVSSIEPQTAMTALLSKAADLGILDNAIKEQQKAFDEKYKAFAPFRELYKTLSEAPAKIQEGIQVVESKLIEAARIGQARQTLASEYAGMQGLSGSAVDAAFQYRGGLASGAGQRMAGQMSIGGLDMSSMALPEYMTSAQAASIKAQYQTAETSLKRIQDLASQGLLKSDEVQKAKDLADNMRNLSSEADKAAQAFKNMTLAQALGTGSGGMQGELADKLLGGLKGKYGGADYDKLKTTLDLQTGRKTEASIAIDKTVEPLLEEIAKKAGPAAAAAAVKSLTEGLQQAKLQGMSSQQIAAALPAMTGWQMSGGQLSQIAQQPMAGGMAMGGMPPMGMGSVWQTGGMGMAGAGGGATGAGAAGDKSMAQIGSPNFVTEITNAKKPMADLSGQMETFSKVAGDAKSAMSGFADHSDKARSNVNVMNLQLQGLAKSAIKITFNFDVVDTRGVMYFLSQYGWLMGGNSAQLNAGLNSPRDNGGAVQGADPRVPAKPGAGNR